jgi:hypothetical protein
MANRRRFREKNFEQKKEECPTLTPVPSAGQFYSGENPEKLIIKTTWN